MASRQPKKRPGRTPSPEGDASSAKPDGAEKAPVLPIRPAPPAPPTPPAPPAPPVDADDDEPIILDRDAPGSDAPGSDAPGSDAPGSDAPGSDTPESDTPESDTPESDTSDEEPIEGGTSGGAEHRQITVRRDVRTRLDVYLHNRLKGLSRSRIQKLIDMGGVRVNDRAPKASTAVKSGDVIDIILPPRAVRRILPEPIPLAVLYEDQHFIVLNKQAGLIVHPARSNLSGTLLNGLAQHFKDQVERAGGTFAAHGTTGFAKQRTPGATPGAATPGGGSGGDEPDGRIAGLSSVGAQTFRPGIIHRLDKNTTGVIVVAKSEEAHWGIARQFEDRTTLKAYLAVVHGNPDAVGGAVEAPIGKHPTIREACAVRHDSSAKHALTLYRVREQYKGYALVELELKTGRTHQIRVHMAYLGHPIVGDILYGGEPAGPPELDRPPQALAARRDQTFAREKEAGQRIEAAARARPDLIIAHPALHAGLLRFVHPVTRQTMTFTAPLHEPMLTLVRELRKRGKLKGPVAKEGFWIDLAKAVR